MNVAGRELVPVQPRLRQVAVQVSLMPDTVDTVLWASDDGWNTTRNMLSSLTDWNKVYSVASCWIIIAILYDTQSIEHKKYIISYHNLHVSEEPAIFIFVEFFYSWSEGRNSYRNVRKSVPDLRRYIPEDKNIFRHRRQKFRSHIFISQITVGLLKHEVASRHILKLTSVTEELHSFPLTRGKFV